MSSTESNKVTMGNLLQQLDEIDCELLSLDASEAIELHRKVDAVRFEVERAMHEEFRIGSQDLVGPDESVEIHDRTVVSPATTDYLQRRIAELRLDIGLPVDESDITAA